MNNLLSAKMPGKKKDESNHANSNAEFLKDLDLQNEVIYNKNTVKKDFILGVWGLL